MKTSKIFVGINGAVLNMSSGSKAVAVYPAGKGDKESFLLMENGVIANMKGSRINGVGVARYLAENGFELAAPGNPAAERLADLLDVRDGLKLVEQQLSERARVIAKEWGGQACTYVPFNPEKSLQPVVVEPPQGYTTTIFDLVNGISAAEVQVKYNAEDRLCNLGADLSKGWLVGPEGTPDAMPRGTEYGGLVERAIFVLCNSGLGNLVGPKNLEMDEDAPEDTLFARGYLEIALTNGDHLTAGITGGDELKVQYNTNGNVLVYERDGMEGQGRSGPTLGSVIGSIAAVLVRVQEMNAEPVKAPRARAKKAA